MHPTPLQPTVNFTPLYDNNIPRHKKNKNTICSPLLIFFNPYCPKNPHQQTQTFYLPRFPIYNYNEKSTIMTYLNAKTYHWKYFYMNYLYRFHTPTTIRIIYKPMTHKKITTIWPLQTTYLHTKTPHLLIFQKFLKTFNIHCFNSTLWNKSPGSLSTEEANAKARHQALEIS